MFSRWRSMASPGSQDWGKAVDWLRSARWPLWHWLTSRWLTCWGRRSQWKWSSFLHLKRADRAGEDAAFYFLKELKQWVTGSLVAVNSDVKAEERAVVEKLVSDWVEDDFHLSTQKPWWGSDQTPAFWEDFVWECVERGSELTERNGQKVASDKKAFVQHEVAKSAVLSFFLLPI